MKIAVIIVSAGAGKRLGKDKAMLIFNGKPLFWHAVKLFDKISNIDRIVLVLKEQNFSAAKKLINDKRVILVKGGKERGDSVRNGLTILDKDITHVLIHDAARLFSGTDLIKRIIAGLKKYPAVICGIPCRDTIKEIDDSIVVRKTLKRERLWQIQTPQGFNRELISTAYAKARKQVFYDDAQLIESLYKTQVKIILGHQYNFKITYPEDITIAEFLMKSRIRDKIGIGVDLHRFADNGKALILCGVRIPCDQGLDAVSDGDAALHAIADAVCGAVGLGDIGDMFPPSDPNSKNLNSKNILKQVLNCAGEIEIGNLDLTIIADKPKLVSHKQAMLESLKNILGINEINIKIKSKEGGEFFGSNDSISCLAAVSVRKTI